MQLFLLSMFDYVELLSFTMKDCRRVKNAVKLLFISSPLEYSYTNVKYTRVQLQVSIITDTVYWHRLYILMLMLSVVKASAQLSN